MGGASGGDLPEAAEREAEEGGSFAHLGLRQQASIEAHAM